VGSARDSRQNGYRWQVRLSEDRFATDLSAPLWSAAPSGPLDLPAESAQPDPPDALCFAETASAEWSGPNQRKLERFAVQGTRPIALRPLGPGGLPAGPWVLADILDISLGGLCLLVSGLQELGRGQPLELDLRCHPDFGVPRLEVDVRWCISSESFTTLGIAFPVPLSVLPELELERRHERRDPNRDDWASE